MDLGVSLLPEFNEMTNMKHLMKKYQAAATIADKEGYHWFGMPNRLMPSWIDGNTAVLMTSYLAGFNFNIRFLLNMELGVDHPVRQASVVSVADVLTNGRVGFCLEMPDDGVLRKFGFDMQGEARVNEASQLFNSALAERNLSYKGKIFETNGFTLSPPPVQFPAPDFYYRCYSEADVLLAAQRGWGINLPVYEFPNPDHAANLTQLYRNQLPREVRGKVSLMLFASIGEEVNQGRVSEEIQKYFLSLLERGGSMTESRKNGWERIAENPQSMIDRSLIGSVQDTRSQLNEWFQSLQPDVLFIVPVPGLGEGESAVTIHRMRQEVMPIYYPAGGASA